MNYSFDLLTYFNIKYFRPQISDDAAALTSILQMTNPFGIQKCLEGLTPKKPGELNYATNPQEIQKILDSSKYVSPNVVPSSGKIKVLPAIKKKVKSNCLS